MNFFRSARTSCTTFSWSVRVQEFFLLFLLLSRHPRHPHPSGGSGLLQMIIRRIRQLANDHLEDPASCKWSSRGSGLLQMIIGRIRPLANDHPADPATCKWSYGGTGHLQMIIRRIWPLANDHPEDPASCKWSSGGSGNPKKDQLIRKFSESWIWGHKVFRCRALFYAPLPPPKKTQTEPYFFKLNTSRGTTSTLHNIVQRRLVIDHNRGRGKLKNKAINSFFVLKKWVSP